MPLTDHYSVPDPIGPDGYVSVESASRPGKFHAVDPSAERPYCTCEAFAYNPDRLCRHIRQARIRVERYEDETAGQP